jgi:hypothetical protein
MQNFDRNIGFLRKTPIFCRKLPKIAVNCDHNIDPRGAALTSPLGANFDPRGEFVRTLWNWQIVERQIAERQIEETMK